MISLISCGSCFIRAVMLRMCFGLVFVGMAVATHTAQSEENPFAPELEILTIQPVRASADWLLPYRLDTNIALIRPTDATSVGSGSSNTPRLHIVAEPKKEAAWSTKAHWQIAPNNSNASLSPILRFESKGERFEIKPRRHSVWVGWHKAFP
jgi:hypothetical protein